MFYVQGHWGSERQKFSPEAILVTTHSPGQSPGLLDEAFSNVQTLPAGHSFSGLFLQWPKPSTCPWLEALQIKPAVAWATVHKFPLSRIPFELAPTWLHGVPNMFRFIAQWALIWLSFGLSNLLSDRLWREKDEQPRCSALRKALAHHPVFRPFSSRELGEMAKLLNIHFLYRILLCFTVTC